MRDALVDEAELRGGVGALVAAAFAAMTGAQVLPPGVDGDCAGQTPIVVASDEAAQSDLYSAATLAGVLDTSCIVLAGGRDEPMDPAQVARLDAAEDAGWLVGGEAAVPSEKIADRDLKRLNGVDRWHTARLAGAVAADPDGDIDALTAATAPAEGAPGDTAVLVDGVEVRLPPGIDSDCAGQVPIVVAADAAAQSDLYSAVTLAGVLDTSCIVLAGARGEAMTPAQQARLDAAADTGWVVGGEAAVPLEKIAGRTLERQGGTDRWHTARLIGEVAASQATGTDAAGTDDASSTDDATTTTQAERRSSSGGGGSSRSSGGTSRRVSSGGGPSRAPTRSPSGTPSPGTTTSTSMPGDTTTTVPDDTTMSDDPTSPTMPGDTTPMSDDPTSTTTPSDAAPTSTTTPDDSTSTTAPPMASMFTPSIEVSVPLLDGTSGTNIWANQELEVTLSRAVSEHSECSLPTAASVTFTVQDDGSVEPDDVEMRAVTPLIGTFAYGARTCEYTLAFQAAPEVARNAELIWEMSTPDDGVLSSTSPNVEGAYTVGPVTFVPDATMMVPVGYAGKSFNVRFTSTPAACTDRTLTYVIGAGVTVHPDSRNMPLVAYPAGANATSELCDYVVEFPLNEQEAGAVLLRQASPAASTMVTGMDQAIFATYDHAPPPEPNAEGKFEVGFEVILDERTTAAEDEYLTYTLSPSSRDCWLEQKTQRLRIKNSVQSIAHDSLHFARTERDGTTPCNYTVTWPTDEDGAWARWRRYDSGSSTDTIVPCMLARCGQLSAKYQRADTSRFVPQIAISVQSRAVDRYVGETFDVTFAQEGSFPVGCAVSGHATYTVQAGSNVALLTGAPPLLVHLPDTSSDAHMCSYTATFPRLLDVAHADGTTTRLTNEGDTTAAISDPTLIERSYVAASTFKASVTMTVPQLAGTMAGENLWNGARFPVRLSRLTRNPGCDLQSSGVVLTYTVNAMGILIEPEFEQPELLESVLRLIDTTADGVECSYTVSFPDPDPSAACRADARPVECWNWHPVSFPDPPLAAADPALIWTMTRGTESAELSAVSPSASSAYTVGTVTFAPDATIDVLTGNDGAEFEVEFAGSAPGCSGHPNAETLTYVVQTGGTTAEQADTNQLLIAYPANAETSEDMCSYTVNFPDNEKDGATLRLQSGAKTIVTGIDQAISAGYGTPFTPSIGLTVPNLDGTTPNTNIWAGIELVVTIARNTASAMTDGCDVATDVAVTFTVDDSGGTTMPDSTQMPSTLIGTTATGDTCGYAVTFPTVRSERNSELLWTLSGDYYANTAELSALSPMVEKIYWSGVIRFDPDVMITVPSGHVGKMFPVKLTSPTEACTDRTYVYEILSGVAVTPQAYYYEPLVAYPAGASLTSDACHYAARFHLTELNGTELALLAGESTSVSGIDQVITAEYAETSAQGSMVDAPSAYSPAFEAVSVGGRFGCGRQTEGTVTCWGRDRYGAVTELPAESFKQIAAGDEHACGVKADDTLTCWGANAGTAGNVPAAQAAVAFEQIVAGDVHSCGRKTDGSVVCWGWDGDGAGRLNVPASTTFSSISASFDHTCGIRSGGASASTVVCWGADDFGQATVPAEHTSTTFISLSAGEQHTCGVRSDRASAGSIVCWGSNGDGRATVPAAELSSLFTAVSAGYAHTCGLKDDNVVTCWGSNLLGEATAPTGSFKAVDAGNGQTCGVRAGGEDEGAITCWGFGNLERAMPPAGAFKWLSAGTEHTCGIASGGPSDGEVDCWGSNGPTGSLDNRSTPPTGAFGAVSAGGLHTCGVRSGGASEGTVTCWGSDAQGQSTDPTGTFRAVSAGNRHTCGIRSGGDTDGTIYCWGDSGDGRTTVPPAVATTQFDVVSAGWSHTCAVKTDDTLVCWGNNGIGEATPPSGTFASVSAGNAFTCGLRSGGASDGAVECWGDDTEGQKTTVPSGPFTAVTAGRDHACALAFDATAVCWGDNSFGATEAPAGVFTALTAGDGQSCGLRVDGATICWGAGTAWQSTRGPATAVASGETVSCALRVDGSVFCWGDNRFDELTVPSLEAGEAFTSVSAGTMHACALKTDGSAACWGYSGGQVPDIEDGLTFTAVSAGEKHSCGLVSDGNAVCWGDFQGQRATALTPPQESASYVALSTGRAHSCALRADESAVCWGYDGPTGSEDGRVSGVPDEAFVSVSAGGRHSCGLKSDGAIVCWGYDGMSPGDGRVSGVPDAKFVSVTAGDAHTCGLKTDQTVACWGSNPMGETTVPAGSFSAVSAGTSHTCGVRLDGAVTCWGYGNLGQADPPARPFSLVAGGREHTCGLRTDDALECWGQDHFGQRTVPNLWVGESFSEVSAGQWHTCALRAGGAVTSGARRDGTVVCWGANGDGQVSPVSPLGTGESFTSVSAGGVHSCGLKSDNSVTCWGSNEFGQAMPPWPSPNESYREVVAGGQHSCGIVSSNRRYDDVECWGNHRDGRLNSWSGSSDPPRSLSAGDVHTCGVTPEQSVTCWGTNVGANSPHGAFSQVAAGGSHSCAVRSGGEADGAIVCWGSNRAGQTDAPEGAFTSVTAGAFHSCGVRSDGRVVCWGAGNIWHRVTGLPPTSS